MRKLKLSSLRSPGFSPRIFLTSGLRAVGLRLGRVQFDPVSKVLLMEVSGKRVPYKCVNGGTSEPKEMTPPLTQNFKTLGLWVFFLICCSTFSFLSNMRLKLTLQYLTHHFKHFFNLSYIKLVN